jgi:Holliday junction resolvase
MSRMSRSKGARGENELCRLLSAELGVTVARNIAQARNGGADCLELKGFAIECKRTERLARPTWWAQAVEQGERAKAEPIVFYRRSREPWQALIRTVDGGYREATWEQAMTHVREKWSCWP